MKIKHWVIAVIIFGMLVIYASAYIYVRKNLILVHYYSTGGGHSVGIDREYGRAQIMAAFFLENEDKAKVVSERMELSGRRMEVVFWPLRIMESIAQRILGRTGGY